MFLMLQVQVLNRRLAGQALTAQIVLESLNAVIVRTELSGLIKQQHWIATSILTLAPVRVVIQKIYESIVI